MKKGLVMEGGGLRGLFTAGVLDVLMENDIEFDGAIGVSAGACFGYNIKSHQIGRALRYNLKFAKDKRYCSFWSLLTSGDIFNVDFCYRQIPYELDKIDFDTFKNSAMEFYAVSTDMETGEPLYGKIDTCDDRALQYIRASASLPLVSRPVYIDGRILQDGGTSDSIPLKYFESLGYDRNIVIATQPKGYVKKKNPLMPMISLAYRKYPKYVIANRDRHIMYNEETKYISEREAAGQALVLYPDSTLIAGRIEHDETKIQATYDEGRKVALRRLDEIRKFHGNL